MQILNGRKVLVARAEVAAFNRVFPCSTLRATRAYWFEFDPVTGDLVDMDCPEQDDGPAAVALSNDCKAFLLHEKEPDWVE